MKKAKFERGLRTSRNRNAAATDPITRAVGGRKYSAAAMPIANAAAGRNSGRLKGDNIPAVCCLTVEPAIEVASCALPGLEQLSGADAQHYSRQVDFGAVQFVIRNYETSRLDKVGITDVVTEE